MDTEIQFARGIFFNAPHPKAPNYILGNISIKSNDLIEFLHTQIPDDKGYIRMVVKVSKGGNTYIAMDTYESKRATVKEEGAESVEIDAF